MKSLVIYMQFIFYQVPVLKKHDCILKMNCIISSCEMIKIFTPETSGDVGHYDLRMITGNYYSSISQAQFFFHLGSKEMHRTGDGN